MFTLTVHPHQLLSSLSSTRWCSRLKLIMLFFAYLTCLIGIGTLSFNMFTLIVLSRTRNNTVHVLLSHYAVVDMFFGIFIIVASIRNMTKIQYEDTIFCAIMYPLILCAFSLSMSILVALSIYFFISVRQVTSNHSGFTPRKANLIMLGIWITNILLCAAMHAPKLPNHNDFYTPTCRLSSNHENRITNIMNSTVFFINWGVMICLNQRTIRIIHRHRKQINVTGMHVFSIGQPTTQSTANKDRIRRLSESILTVCITSLLFTVCIVPYSILNTIRLNISGDHLWLNTAIKCMITLTMINKLINILVYYKRMSSFRQTMHMMRANCCKY